MPGKFVLGLSAALAVIPVLPAAAQDAETVKITPLGSHDGEFCRMDRALVLEDPNGTRILYDAGRTVAGPNDPRLGDIDVVLLSHMHGDHLGDKHMAQANAGTCDSPDASVSALPATNTVAIAHGKKAVIVAGSEMPKFLGTKLKAAGGDPASAQLVRFGASRSVGGVDITTVPATHSNGIGGDIVGGDLGAMLNTAGLTAHAGPPTGYVLTFSNGLVAYLSGDTGVTAEQKTVVADQYGARLVVINIGDTFTTGPSEAAHVINTLIQPAAVIPSHANEAATEGGQVLEGTRTEAFIQASDVPVHLPLSGRTMAFDADGTCVSGC
jgi:L-ascorbate metabolism protein UlaG (beta-lactamase superfamily)